LVLATSGAIGAAIWSLIFFVLGLAGAYYPATAITAVVIGTLLIVVPIGPKKKADADVKIWSTFSAAEWSLVSLVGFAVLILLVGALAPPTAKDTLLYHFALPKAYVAQHGLSFVEGNIASYIALGSEMHNVWAMLLGGLFSPRAAEAAAGATNFWFFPLLLMA